MDVDLPAEDDPRRLEVRAWFADHPQPSPKDLVDAGFVGETRAVTGTARPQQSSREDERQPRDEAGLGDGADRVVQVVDEEGGAKPEQQPDGGRQGC